MKSHLGIALVAASLLGAGSEDEANKIDTQKWQGTWLATSMESDGKVSPDAVLAKIRLTVEGTDYHFQNGDFHERGAYKFMAASNPKQLDIVVGDGAGKGKVYFVIYKFDGDELAICLRTDNKERPREFTGRAGSGCVLETWRHVKP